MENSQKHIVLVAGEPSGDIYAAHLVDNIKKIDPSVTFSGLGGFHMKAAGVKLHADLTRYAVIGFVEFFKHLKIIKGYFRLIVEEIKRTNPDLVVLVDFPGFNLRLARELKKLNQRIVYYISPQIWASRKGRIETVCECVEKILVFFKFEEELYKQRGIPVTWVGHPLLDIIKTKKTKESFLDTIGFSASKLTIALLPGSREKEIEKILPVMIQTAKILYQKNNNFQFIVLKAENLSEELFFKYLSPVQIPLKMVNAQTHDGIHAADICLVASGTATLEVGILGKPMVLIYKTSFLTWVLARLFIRIPYIGLVNVIAGRKIVPEFIQFDTNPQRIARGLESLLHDELQLADMILELGKIRETLGKPGASQRAAKEVLSLLSG